jgi:hypothetical protein
MGDQWLLGYLVEVMDVYWKSGSYPEYVATFPHAGPTPTELTLRAKVAKAKVNGWRISWLQENPKSAGSASRTRSECYKGAATIAAALSIGCRQDDLSWDKRGALLRCKKHRGAKILTRTCNKLRAD